MNRPTVQPSMLITSSTWNQKTIKSFKMIPLTKECPYIDVFFDPEAQILVIHSEKTKNNYTLLPELDNLGHTKYKGNDPLVGRHRVEAYKEYYITEREEIIDFVNMLAFNADTFDFAQYIGSVIMVEQQQEQEENSTVALN